MSIPFLIETLSMVLGLALFFGTATLAIIFRDREIVRKGFVVVFILLLIGPNIGAPIRWPFMYWGLFADAGPIERTGYEWRVADEHGNEIKYDNQAAEPVLVLERYGFRVVERDDEYASEIGNHLLQEARDYREVVADGGTSHLWWAFPEHQIRHHWTPQQVESIGPFESVRLYCLEAEFDREGSTVEHYEETLVAQINDSATYVNRSAC